MSKNQRKSDRFEQGYDDGFEGRPWRMVSTFWQDYADGYNEGEQERRRIENDYSSNT